ncbi:hypothetical protein [Mucilaginibacter rubeus]|jgi:hypothetical protein|uniref:hypothetical protein n=1 Tax=Mucilaginibacter rubeus TaxID=2027860 RepID=UPI001664DDA3|nr:hypothetical protein [Mucilaginibacter rubeus]
MTNQYRSLVIAIIISSCLIIVGAGHGAVPMMLIEIMAPIAKGLKFSLQLSNNNEDTLAASALFFFIGQLLLFFGTHRMHVITRLIGVIFMWTGLFYQTHNMSNDGGAKFTFATGAPFLFLSIALFSFDVRQNWLQDKTDIEEE